MIKKVSWQDVEEAMDGIFFCRGSEKEKCYLRFRSTFGDLFRVRPKDSEDVLTIDILWDDDANNAMRLHLRKKDEDKFNDKHCKTMACFPERVIGMNVDDVTSQKFSFAEIVAYTILEIAYCQDRIYNRRVSF